ncbi:MAG: PD40 domain-containing protein [Candidatus Delongbacteria bacterium]|nr:PD40 domain-containing protein [Candidatus Delongbacteria bacterium]
MKNYLIVLLILAIQLFSIEPNFMSDPAISPEGDMICFRYMNDLWTVSYKGGEAKRLTSVKGADYNPDYSPDGKMIAFNSDREGYGAVYVIPSNGGSAVKVITGDYFVVDWYKDSQYLLLMKGERFVGNKMYRVKIDGTGLTDLDIFGNLYGDLSSDNDKFIFCNNGDPFREKYTGSANGSLHLFDLNINDYTDVYDSPLTERYPVFSKTGKGIYFARSDSNLFQICNIPEIELEKKDPKVEQITNFNKWSARDISIAYKNDRMVFEYFDKLWVLDPTDKVAKELKINIAEDIIQSPKVILNNISTTDKFYVSPKGDWILFRYKFDLFAVPFEGGEEIRITGDAKGIGDFVISDDNETIYYTAFVKGETKLFKTSVKDPINSELIEWSKDKIIDKLKIIKGKMFVFYSEGDDRFRLAVRDRKKDIYEEIVPDKYVLDIDLSNDGNLLLYTELVGGLYSINLYILNLEEKKEKMISSYNEWLWRMSIDPKEEFLFYNIGDAVYRTDLKKVSDYHFEKDKWKEIFTPQKDKKKDKTKKEKKEPSEFFTTGLKEKGNPLLNKPGINYIIKLTEDQKIFYINEFSDKIYLRKTDFQAKDDELITEITGGKITDVSYADSTGGVFYLQRNKIKAFDMKSKKIKDTPFDIKYSYDQQKIYSQLFDEIYTSFKRGFYDPEMHGVNLDKMYDRFKKYMDQYHIADSFGFLIDEMIGNINSSHTGYYPNQESEVPALPVAVIGAEFDFKDRMDKGLKISKVYFQSKLAEVHDIKAGDVLLSVDDVNIERDTDIDELFVNKVDDKIKLKIRSGKIEEEISVKGLSSDYMLKYDDWVNDRKLKVDELSKGKVGYLHIRGMNESSYEKFLDDLFTDNFNKEALIIDVRFNGGGYTHDRLIEVLTKKQYAYSSARWDHAVKRKTPFDIWDKPSTVIINDRSFSDAEIFPTLYKDLGLGKVIGTPTSGAVIGTSSHTLMDGSSMRMPLAGWWRLNGENMEGNGTQPDIRIDMSFKDKIEDNDVQLERAVEEMLKAIDNR